jgi:hypothetical protein
MPNILVGNYTKVLKLIVGTPTGSAVVSNSVNIADVVGVDVTGAQDGALLIYNDSSNTWEAVNDFTFEDSVIDGKVYPGNTARQKILIRRSGTQGDPLILRTGELAYSWLLDSSSDGFGNGGDRLYIGTGLEIDSAGIIRAARIDTIGGRYFTNLLNHEHGVVTASSAIITDSNSRVDNLKTSILRVYDSAVINEATITTLNTTTINADIFTADILTINKLIADSARIDLSVINNLVVDSSMTVNALSVFNDSVSVNSNLFFVDGVKISEFIDSDVAQLLQAGTGIALTYSDSTNSLTIAGAPATLTTLGAARFGGWADSAQTVRQFSVDSGNVRIMVIDGGFIEYDSTMPG